MLPFQTTFAVPLSCDTCVKDVSARLYHVNGVTKVNADLDNQLVSVEGIAPPSALVAAIQATGRDAILRGSGASDSAGVCILETHSKNVPNRVRGLARMVQVSPALTVVDLTTRGLTPGRYWTTVRETGNICDGAASTGGIWGAIMSSFGRSSPPKGLIGSVDVGPNGAGSIFVDRPVQIWELIGRSMVVSTQRDGPFQKEDPNTLVGVIARSAGAWDNHRTVCSCSGKTLWEERRENVDKGML